MKFSAAPCLRMPAQKNGLNTVRLQVILNRKVLLIPLHFAWPEVLWDGDTGRCLAKLPPQHRTPYNKERLEQLEAAVGGDLAKKAADYNLVIGQAVGTATEIAVTYRLSKRHLTADEFLREYNTGASKDDFLAYMGARIEERYRRSQISENTRKSHVSTLNKVREFVAYSKQPTRKKRFATVVPVDPSEATLPFCTLNHKFSHDFDAWLKTEHRSCTNTRSGRHRNVKTYLELARRDKISFEDPYEYFVNTTVAGQWKALTPDELTKLEHHYTRFEPGSKQRRILQKFLFSCHCGLRLGDLKRLHKAKIQGQQIELQPHKTYRYDEKDLVLPITKAALRYLNDSRQENECEAFWLYSDQYTNRELRIMGTNLKIKTKLHHHIGRETFATNFIRQGGKVEVLQKLLGHKKLSMTMKYVHVDEAMKKAEIERLDKLAGH